MNLTKYVVSATLFLAQYAYTLSNSTQKPASNSQWCSVC